MIAHALSLLVFASTSSPDSIVVFPDRAQVTRSSAVNCGSRVPVVFTQVPPSAARESFRALSNGGNVDGLRADLDSSDKEFSPKVEALNQKLQQLEDQRTELNDEMDRARGQLKIGARYEEVATQLVSKEMALEKPDTRGWASAFAGALNSRLNASAAVSAQQVKLRALEKEIALVNRDLEGLSEASRKEFYTVEVLVSCAAGQNATVSLSYVIGGASWVPSYEARANESAATVELSTIATVRQQSGEDWSGVKLVLSTAIPSQNATPPELNRLELRASERPEQKKVLVRRDEYIASAKSGSTSGGESDGRMTSRNQGLSVQLTVPQQAKVSGDGTAVRLFVGKTNLKAKFLLSAMPALLPAVFRTAELTNQGDWPLLAGRVDAFRSGSMMGRYDLERVAQGAAFTLTFGIEENVRVKRTVVEELKKDAGLFNSKRRFNFAYKFEVANYGKAPVEVALADRVPVAEVDDVTVSMGEKTTSGSTTGDKNGIITWPVKLKPQERKTVDLAFSVDVPTSYDSGNL